MLFLRKIVACIVAVQILAACAGGAPSGALPPLSGPSATHGSVNLGCIVTPEAAGHMQPQLCATPTPCPSCIWSAPPTSGGGGTSSPTGPTEGPVTGPGFGGCLGATCYSGPPLGGGGTYPVYPPVGVSHPIGTVLPPYLLSMQQWLRDDGVSTYDISTFEADEAVRTWYGLTASEFEPSFVGEAIEGTWTEAATAAFSSAGTPNLAVPSTLTDNTLIQFLNTSSLDYKPFTTTIGTLTENNVTTAEGIQNLFAMPTAPNTVTAVSGYEDGTRFIIGEAAENAYGAGGGLQVFGESQALAVGEEMSIGDFLEMLALALLDRQRHTAIHR